MGAETTNDLSDTFEVDREKLGLPRKKRAEDEEETMEATPLPPMPNDAPRDAAEY